MKKFINVAGLLLLSASAASAQLLEQARITVPFAFVAAGKVLPAGDYKVQVNPDHNVLVISSHDRLSAMALVPGSERSAQPGTRVRFRHQDENGSSTESPSAELCTKFDRGRRHRNWRSTASLCNSSLLSKSQQLVSERPGARSSWVWAGIIRIHLKLKS